MSNFGSITDHFGLITELPGVNLKLVNSSKTPVDWSRANAMDENGDIAASAYYGNQRGMAEVSCTYAFCSGIFNLQQIRLGIMDFSTTTVRQSIEVTTSNTEFPQITLTGRTNIASVTAPPDRGNKFAIPSFWLNGTKRAQPMHCQIAGGGRCTGSSLSANIEIHEQADGAGEIIAHGISGGVGTFSVDGVRTSSTTPPTFSLVTSSSTPPVYSNTGFGLAITQYLGTEEGQASFHTFTAAGAFSLIRLIAGA